MEEGGSGAACHGPVTQAHFLASLGIGARLEALQREATPADAAQLQAGYERCAPPGGAVFDLHAAAKAARCSQN